MIVCGLRDGSVSYLQLTKSTLKQAKQAIQDYKAKLELLTELKLGGSIHDNTIITSFQSLVAKDTSDKNRQ